MHLNRRAKVFIGAWVVVVAWLAYQAQIPNPHAIRLSSDEPRHEYLWIYPVGFVFLGVLVFFLLKLWRTEHTFVGAITAFAIFCTLFVIAALGSMHSPPVHWYATHTLLAGSLVLLFYSGYSAGRNA